MTGVSATAGTDFAPHTCTGLNGGTGHSKAFQAYLVSSSTMN